MAYLFCHFISDEGNGEQIYFSVSQDGLHWEDLNEGEPVLTSQIGEKGVRDPYLLRMEDGSGFTIIATDLRIAAGKGWQVAQHEGSRDLIVYQSKDLIHWDGPKAVTVGVEGAGCVWAPEAIYDREHQDYLVFWASMTKLDGECEPKQRIYAAKTGDFLHYTTPEIYLEKENHVIDTTMIFDQGEYYRFSKNETDHNIRIDKAENLEKNSFHEIHFPNVEALEGVEGPECYYLEDRKEWCLIVDQFATKKGYLPLVCKNLKTEDFRVLSPEEYDMGKTKKRHGSVLVITEDEYSRLKKKW